ncbi:MAG TPA: hypothetical protein VER96_41240 [Polyangiaceae bacterium]|nr:hypothetical protein [Polyangiaceae bacterium]
MSWSGRVLFLLPLLVLGGCYVQSAGAVGPSTGAAAGASAGRQPKILRHDLTPKEFEAGNYGAYSYVLLRSTSDDRVTPLVRAFLEHIPDSGRATPSGNDNITYFPVLAVPPPSEVMNVAWHVQNYDVGRAVTILRGQGLDGRGPYLITSKRPLSGSLEIEPNLSILDLSDATPESAPLWLVHFIRVTEHPEDWLSNGTDTAALKVHDSFAAAAGATKSVVESLSAGRKLLRALIE